MSENDLKKHVDKFLDLKSVQKMYSHPSKHITSSAIVPNASIFEDDMEIPGPSGYRKVAAPNLNEPEDLPDEFFPEVDEGFALFSMSGLLEMYETDWEKSRQLIEDGGVLDSPWAASSCLVHSESNPKQPNGVTYTKKVL